MSRVDLTYWFMAHLTASAMTVCRARWQVIDADFMPRSGPFIMASNHMSDADPALLVASTSRRMAFLAKEELKQEVIPNFILWAMGALTIKRGKADRAALRIALDALKSGQPIAIFPEGTRSRGRGLQAGQAGAALLAQWSGVPVVPAAIWGSEHIRLPKSFFNRPAVTVRFGEPLTLAGGRTGDDRRLPLNEATDLIMRRIADLLPERHRGVYTGPGGPVLAAADDDPRERAAL